MEPQKIQSAFANELQKIIRCIGKRNIVDEIK